MSTNKQNYIQSEEINPIQVYKNDTKENENLNNQNKKCDCDFWKPDCCFCSESKCYNCSDYNNYPSINIPNAILFNLISNLAILLIIYLNKNHKNGQKIFWSKKEDKNDIIILYVVFGIEFIFYSPFIFSIPFYESCGSYPSLASLECCQTIFACITYVQCFCCVCCCCCICKDSEIFFKFTSKCIRYIYKTGFYFYNIFFIPTIIIFYIFNEDEKILDKREKWVIDVFISFIIIDFITFIHSIIYGNKTEPKRNVIFSFVGVLISFFIYLKLYKIKTCGFLIIPTFYYFIFMNFFVFLMKNKWHVSLYPLYGSVGFLFILLCIPLVLLLIALSIAILIIKCCGDCCDKISSTSRTSSKSKCCEDCYYCGERIC